MDKTGTRDRLTGPGRLLRLEDVAAELAVSKSTVERMVAGAHPELPSIRIRGARRVRRHDLDRWLERQ